MMNRIYIVAYRWADLQNAAWTREFWTREFYDTIEEALIARTSLIRSESQFADEHAILEIKIASYVYESDVNLMRADFILKSGKA